MFRHLDITAAQTHEQIHTYHLQLCSQSVKNAEGGFLLGVTCLVPLETMKAGSDDEGRAEDKSNSFCEEEMVFDD